MKYAYVSVWPGRQLSLSLQGAGSEDGDYEMPSLHYLIGSVENRQRLKRDRCTCIIPACDVFLLPNNHTYACVRNYY